jgi:hypothetical protein
MVATALREVSPSADIATYGRLLNLEMALASAIANLSTKLRLTNQSRYGKRTAEREAQKARGKPWDLTIIDGGKSETATVSPEPDASTVTDVTDADDENAWN